MRHSDGFTLLEILIVLAIIGVIAICAAPAFGTYRRNASMRAEAAELRGIFRAVRSRAITRATHAGVKFTRAGNTWVYSLYDDGNGNGIRSAEIASGVDRRYAGLVRTIEVGGRVVMLDKDEAAKRIPDLYEDLRRRHVGALLLRGVHGFF